VESLEVSTNHLWLRFPFALRLRLVVNQSVEHSNKS
jgi:hypothetical protein